MGILYAQDVQDLVEGVYPYENEDGSMEEVTIREMLLRISKNYFNQEFNPLALVFPFLSRYKLVNPFRRDYKNLLELRKAIRKIVSSSKDTESIGSIIYNYPHCSKEENVCDLLLSMIGGTDTSSHAITAGLYFLNKYPKCLEKLRKELLEKGFNKDNFDSHCTLENLQKCDFLACVVKEIMRRDTISTTTLTYAPTEDITVCDVPIQKGQKIKFDFIASKFDDSKWLEPLEFVPERRYSLCVLC